jgi:hypothetical protein
MKSGKHDEDPWLESDLFRDGGAEAGSHCMC